MLRRGDEGAPLGEWVEAMCRQMVHRGPDDEGTYSSGGIGMGMRRLSIINVGGGHQPMSNEDDTVWVVFNGEIYNHRELRAELEAQAHVFRTQCDTEVIVHAYEQWGDDCFLHFNGIFGIALWDEARHKLVLARDHFGVKPLYYYEGGGRVVWASEIKAMLVVPGVPCAPELAALDAFLVFGSVPSPDTMFCGIRKLPPGHRLVCVNSKTRLERYFRPSELAPPALSEAEWIESLQLRFEAAVHRQMVSDVPIGALLSGGVDSAMVVAVMAGVVSRPIKTFTVGFKDGCDSDERADAAASARLFGTEHHEIVLDHLDYTDLIGKIVWQLDEPVATPSALAMYCVCHLAQRHVKVALTGQGADEPMAGYPRYYGERYGFLFRQLPNWMRRGVLRPAVDALPRNDRAKRAVRSLGLADPAERFAAEYAIFTPELRGRLWLEEFQKQCDPSRGVGTVRYWLEGTGAKGSLGQMTFVDARLALADDLLLYGDKVSMAASIEARVPFLDLQFMEAAESLPANLKIRGLTRKYLHKKVAAKWLPPEVIFRRKRGFVTPIDKWFRSELSGYVAEMLTGENSACSRYFHRPVIKELLHDHVVGGQDYRRHLFALLTFELWHRLFIDRSLKLAPASRSGLSAVPHA